MLGSAVHGRFVSKRTVDRDGDALKENIAVGADEGRDLGEGVELEVLGRRVGGVDLLNLEVEVVGLRDGVDCRGAGVELLRRAKISMRGRAKGGVRGGEAGDRTG